LVSVSPRSEIGLVEENSQIKKDADPGIAEVEDVRKRVG